MHIFHTLFTHVLGGLEQSYLDYTDALIESGHRVTALVDPQAPYLAQLETRRVDILPVRCFGYYDLFAASAVRKHIRALRPDLLLGHNSRAMTLLRKARGSMPVPLVGVSHSNKTKRAMGMDALITLTPAMAQHFAAAGYSAAQVHTIPNMIRIDAEHTHPHRPVHDVPVIGAMGRFTEEKGFDVLIDAAFQLTRRRVPFRLLLAGEGPLRGDLEEKVEMLGLRKHVTFNGWVEERDVFFDELDLFCLPSRQESFGLVILESWMRGVPVVATECDGPSTLITPKQNGLLTPIGDDYALADALHQLIDEPDLAGTLSEGGLDSVQAYRMDAVGRLIDGVLQGMLQSKASVAA